MRITLIQVATITTTSQLKSTNFIRGLTAPLYYFKKMTKTKSVAIIRQLSEIAQKRGLTQQQIADATGLSRATVNRIFGYKFTPKIDTVVLIAGAVGANVVIE